MPVWVRSTLCLVFWVAQTPRIHADGGTIRASEIRGDYILTVFTSPTPARAGDFDISILVQQGATKRVVPATRIRVTAQWVNDPGVTISARVTQELATNKLFQAATLLLPQAGLWTFDVLIEEEPSLEPVRFSLDLESAPAEWRTLNSWVMLPLVAIALFVVHRILQARRPARG